MSSCQNTRQAYIHVYFSYRKTLLDRVRSQDHLIGYELAENVFWRNLELDFLRSQFKIHFAVFFDSKFDICQTKHGILNSLVKNHDNPLSLGWVISKFVSSPERDYDVHDE